ncbi:PTS system cellobiose-specific IIA component [Sporolactobacillus spathodeae]|uniref:PTS system cellobiose-specific IIA component n=2 Tax=Sporolactobacillus spathodeae TaxID=1465502 RepID=A0ABS2Q952_9BACL|nr:PTS lactose/cellobiose transporter subunit IIA [Sporolactobacillus spathodeae]MBM7658151.1 PTS system cellobiose-specific IIA component [Sporolactobacillus spathodeae]
MKQEETFQLILHGGNGRSSAMEAVYQAKEGKFDEARESLKKAGEELVEAHHVQTKALQDEITGAGEKKPVSLLEVHGQDHLMNAITVKDLATELVDLYAYIDKKLAERMR